MEYWITLRRSLAAGRPSWLPGRRAAAAACILGALLATCELSGRALGLHTPVLYEATSYGYRARPLQDIWRFGNHIHYDRFGLRSDGVAAAPAADGLRILCLGDSITNGGAITDQADTYPQILERELRASGKQVEVFNASAPGWAIANEAGWLRANGIFGARVVVLTIGTTDLFQETAPADIVDRHPAFPSRGPSLALEELLMRYARPRLLGQSSADPGSERDSLAPSVALSMAAAAIDQVLAIADGTHSHGAVPVVLYVEQPDPFEPADRTTLAAKTLLFDALKRKGIDFVTTGNAFRSAGGEKLFRDRLHPNADGNRVLARLAAALLQGVDPALK